MSRVTKKKAEVIKKYDFNKTYNISDAINLVKSSDYSKFNSSIDVAIPLGIDPKKTDQIVRGSVVLPHGTGKKSVVLVLCNPDKEKEAKDAGADYVGLDDYIQKIENGWCEVDVILTVPSIMANLARRVGKILGPKGLMPNPKTNTVTDKVGDAVREIRAGKVNFKADKFGIIHASIGRVSFLPDHLEKNFAELLNTLVKLKPTSAKNPYVKNITISSTMGCGVRVDKNSVL
jgi:large subunit ribosomal protein L1